MLLSHYISVILKGWFWTNKKGGRSGVRKEIQILVLMEEVTSQEEEELLGLTFVLEVISTANLHPPPPRPLLNAS